MSKDIVDGVPVFWCETPGPLRAGLVLRMGWGDETLLTRGIGHMLEHLVLHGIRRPGDHSNGMVEASTTLFVVHGDPTEVVDFLAQLTRQLAAPPVQRLREESAVLLSEQAGRRPGPLDRLLDHRHGAGSYGLGNYEELGVRALTPEAMTEWSLRFATRDNAALWLSGPPPGGLRLHLTAGTPRAAPDPRQSLLGGSPAWFTGPSDGVAMNAVVPRGWAAVALGHILNTRLVDRLRVREAVAYSPAAGYRPVTGEHGWLTAGSDLVSGRQSEGVRPFLALLRQLAGEDEHGVSQADLDAYRLDVRRAADDPAGAIGVAVAEAWDSVFGIGPHDEDRLDAMLGVGVDEVRAVAALAMEHLVAEVPVGLGPRRGGWSAQPRTRSEPGPAAGSTMRHTEYATNGRTLTYGQSGVTLQAGGEQVTAVVAGTAAVQRWRDGRRVIITFDGMYLDLEPTMWLDGAAVTSFVDRHWPASAMVDMGSRGLEEIPRPDPAATADPIPPPPARDLLQRPVLLASLVFLAGVVVFVYYLIASGRPTPILGALTVGFTVFAYRFARHRWTGGA